MVWYGLHFRVKTKNVQNILMAGQLKKKRGQVFVLNEKFRVLILFKWIQQNAN